MLRRALVATTLMLVVACGGNRQPAGPRTSSDILTRAEIASVPEENLYYVVERLRPMFLRARPTAARTSAFAVVFIDGIRRGAPGLLHTINANSVEQIRYLSPADATTRYGLDVAGGVIDVTMRR